MRPGTRHRLARRRRRSPDPGPRRRRRRRGQPSFARRDRRTRRRRSAAASSRSRPCPSCVWPRTAWRLGGRRSPSRAPRIRARTSTSRRCAACWPRRGCRRRRSAVDRSSLPTRRPPAACSRREACRRPIHNNCSGKHAAMLATCAVMGWPLDGYMEPGHPCQQAVTAALRRCSASISTPRPAASTGAG